jgi:hypothetical protein
MSFTRLSPGIWQIAVSTTAQEIEIDNVKYNLDASNTYSIVVKKVGRINDDTSKIKAKFNPLTEPGAFKNN